MKTSDLNQQKTRDGVEVEGGHETERQGRGYGLMDLGRNLPLPHIYLSFQNIE